MSIDGYYDLYISLTDRISDAKAQVVTIFYGGDKQASINISTDWCPSKTFSPFNLDDTFPSVVSPGSVYLFEVATWLEDDAD